MKNLILTICFLTGLFAINTQAQGDLNPVKWTFSVTNFGGGEYQLNAVATIDEGWHLYSQNIKDGGPIPTTFNFNNESDLTENETRKVLLVEKGEDVVSKFDPIFEMNLKWFNNKAHFSTIMRADQVREISGYVEFMTCDDKRCLPPTSVDFAFMIDPNAEVTQKPQTGRTFKKPNWNEKVSKVKVADQPLKSEKVKSHSNK